MDTQEEGEGVTATSKTLHDKLVEVATAIRNIEKGGRNAAQNYSFVQEADVVRTVYPELLSRGIMFYPAMRRMVGPIVEYATKSGAASFLTTVESVWRATDGKDVIEVASMGQGTDTGGDKGIYKALTGDKKYAVLQLLGIATGDDAEASGSADTSEAAPEADGGLTDEQKSLLMAEVANTGLDPEDLGARIFEWTGKRSVKALTSDDLTKILENLRDIQAVAAAAATA